MRSLRWVKMLVGIPALVLLAACGSHGARTTAGASLEPARVRVAKAVLASRLSTEDAPGTVRPRTRARLEAKISGRILRLPVEVGDTVEAGDTVVELDAEEIRARLDQARARLDQAARDRRRMENLLKRQAVTRRQYDQAEAAYRVALAAVEEAQTMLQYTAIRAPFSGVITAKLADVGDLALPGKPLLVLDDPRALQVEVFVPESLIDRVALGDPLMVRVPGRKGEITGRVSEVAPAADPATRTFRVKIDLPEDAGIRLGQFVRVAIPAGEVHSVRVPLPAVVRRGQLDLVFVVADGTAVMRLVKTGKRVGETIEVLAGLDGGETVVVDGAASLVDGQPVEIL